MEGIRSQQADLSRSEEKFGEYVKERRRSHSEALVELDESLKSELESLEKSQKRQLEEMRKGYQVEISREAKDQQAQLLSQRKEFEARKGELSKEAEVTFKKIEAGERLRIANYKKHQDEVLAKLQKQYQDATEEFRRRGEA